MSPRDSFALPRGNRGNSNELRDPIAARLVCGGEVTDQRRQRGADGEDAAAAFLRKQGWLIVERNSRLGRGELDIVALDGDALVFVEVKARAQPHKSAFSPFDSVGHQKQRQLRSLGSRWLGERGGALLSRAPREIRFDLIGVVVTGGQTTIKHIRDAF